MASTKRPDPDRRLLVRVRRRDRNRGILPAGP